jgi:ATP-dependent Zn protease
MDTAVAGRIAEEIVYGAENAETGASSDFQNLMRTAKDFVMRYGFSEKVWKTEIFTDVVRLATSLFKTMNTVNYRPNNGLS